MKLKTKFALMFSAFGGLIIAFFAITIYLLSAEYREEQFISRLKDKALTMSHLLFQVEVIDENILNTINENRWVLPDERVIIYDYNLTLIYNSNPSIELEIDDNIIKTIIEKEEIKLKLNNSEVIGFTYQYNNSSYIIISSAFDRFGYGKLKHLKYVLIISYLFSIVLVYLFGSIFSYSALKPITSFVENIENISINNINTQLKHKTSNNEIGRLTNAFNNMLSRIYNAFEIQKSFVSNASHEFRTPLTSIIGNIDLSLIKERSNEEYKEFLISIREDISNLTKITNDLLIMAQIDLEKQKESTEIIRLDEVLLLSQGEIIKYNPEYKINISFKEIPEDELLLSICANETIIKVLFINLIDNACKFSPNKSVNIQIVPKNDKTHIIFTDNGIGIPKDEIENITRPFFRASNSQDIKGHGLGLSIVNQIIKTYDGDLLIESNAGKGTTITISFNNSYIA